MAPTSEDFEQAINPVKAHAIVNSWPLEVKNPIKYEIETCSNISGGTRFPKTPIDLVPQNIKDYMHIRSTSDTLPWHTEPPAIIFGIWTPLIGSHVIPESLERYSSAPVSMAMIKDTKAIIYIPRIAIFGTQDRVECCAAGCALDLGVNTDVLAALRDCLRITWSWGHVGLVVDFASLWASREVGQKGQEEVCRSDLVNALGKVLQESEFQGRWKFVALLSTAWRDSVAIEEQGLDMMTV